MILYDLIMMSYKEITKASYAATAEEFAHKVTDLAPKESIERFLSLLPKNGKMIDLGSGSGRDAKMFTERGLEVIGIDYCIQLINIAKKNAPLAQFQVMDIEEISFPSSSFDGVWAGCSLVHVPKKICLSVLSNIHSILKNDGYFYLTLKKGSGERLEKDLRYGNFEKFWSFYEEEEMKKMLERSGFKILELCSVEKRFPYQTHTCLRAFCQKI